jgi:hypothetical protein
LGVRVMAVAGGLADVEVVEEASGDVVVEVGVDLAQGQGDSQCTWSFRLI